MYGGIQGWVGVGRGGGMCREVCQSYGSSSGMGSHMLGQALITGTQPDTEGEAEAKGRSGDKGQKPRRRLEAETGSRGWE